MRALIKRLRLSPHARAQLIRFGRLFAVTLLSMLAGPHGPLTVKALGALAVAAAEVAVRQLWKVDAPPVRARSRARR